MNCVEIDGPGVAYFFDGAIIITYASFSLCAQHPKTVRDLIKTMDERIAKIKERSEVIMWRVRPKIEFKYVDGRDSIEDGIPEEGDYKNKNAYIRIRCRLACYPPLEPNEFESFGRTLTNGDGPEIQ